MITETTLIRTKFFLDGTWLFYRDPQARLTPARLVQTEAVPVPVPAPWQAVSPELREYSGPAWYGRSFQIPDEWTSGGETAVVLGFGAVDYLAEVWVNGQRVGEHEGGYLPFELEIGPLLHPGENQLAVRVSDPLELFPEVPHGKQSWYGMLSGIWQSVWIERRPVQHIQGVKITPHPVEGWVQVEVSLSRPLAAGERLGLEVVSPAGETVTQAALAGQLPGAGELSARLNVPDPELWEPAAPRLYTLRVTLDGSQPDELCETFGFRTIETQGGRILLNGRPLYLRAALDQDYYPDLISTPPSVEFIEAQFRQAKAMGLNCLRTHIKIADPRYYAAADRLGLLIWTELPNWQTLTLAARQRARATLTGMIQRDWNHPSIIIWTLINESWGIDLTDPSQRAWLAETYDFAKGLDPYRLVVGNSACAGNFQVVTDLEDFHAYYAIPDHYRKWRSWVKNFSSRPAWTFAHEYQSYPRWRSFRKDPWKRVSQPLALEVRRRGDEPLVLSEFGNWGLPGVSRLYAHYGGEPWWFNNGLEWDEGQVYPHGFEDRFRAYHLERAFPDLAGLVQASQQQQAQALQYEIEQIRRQDEITGYVITEFTDVHWECNGLLDMVRNPKLAAKALPAFNADDVLIPEWRRRSYWEGECCQVDVFLSHYSGWELDGSRLEWEVCQAPHLHGQLDRLKPAAAGVSRLGRIEFDAPAGTDAHQVQLELRLVTREGKVASANQLTLYVYPRQLAAAPIRRVYAPELAPTLRSLGYTVVDTLEAAEVAVVTTLNDDMRTYLLQGGRAVWLAEADAALQTYLGELKLEPRRGTAWQGDWASSLIWVCRDRLFSSLAFDEDRPTGGSTTGGLADFAFADLTPNHVITGLRPVDYAIRVHAALAVGWLHKPAGVVVEYPLGQGRLVISTFQLSRQLERHPLAAILLKALVQA